MMQVKSLENTCIKIIVEYFDTFLIALNQDDNLTVKNNLQRYFTDVLIEEVKGPLRKQHAHFLINRYLRKLDMTKFSSEDIKDVIEILKKQGQGILNAKLSGPERFRCLGYSESILIQLICSLPTNLRCLSLDGTKCTDKVLKKVASECPKLQQLSIWCCKRVTDEGIAAAFSNCNQPINDTLQVIHHYGTSVTYKGIVILLDNCPNLREIFGGDFGTALSCILKRYNNSGSQSRKYNLERLQLNAEDLEAAHAMFPNGKILSISDVKTERQINICKKFTKLEDVTFFSIESVSLTPFFESIGSQLLYVFILGKVILPVESLIQFCPRIQYLKLYYVKFGSDKEQSLDCQRFLIRDLKKLIIAHVNLTAEAQYANTLFNASPNLEMCIVDCVTGFSHVFANTIMAHRLPCLNELRFCDVDVDVQCIKRFIEVAPNLNRILIDNCPKIEAISQSERENLKQLRSGLRVMFKDIDFYNIYQ